MKGSRTRRDIGSSLWLEAALLAGFVVLLGVGVATVLLPVLTSGAPEEASANGRQSGPPSAPGASPPATVDQAAAAPQTGH